MAKEGLFGIGGADEAALQRQLDEQRATEFAKMSNAEKLGNLAYTSTAGAGRALLGAFGVDANDPEVRAKITKQRIANEIDYNDLNSVAEGVRKLAQGGFAEDARQLATALENTKKTRAEAEAKLAEKMTPEQRNARELSSLKLKIEGLKRMDQADPAVKQALETFQAQYDALSGLTAKADSKSEFERILDSLNLPPEQKRQMQARYVEAKLNPDPSGLKGLNAQLASLQIQQAEFNLTQKKDKAELEKITAIEKLSNAESSLDSALNTAEKALKLAPGSFTGAAGQAVTSSIPWTDAKALKNLVSSLNSEKVIQTLEQMKAQSRTGATGFGSVSEKELQLMLDKIRALDPSDKMFKENLETVMQGWNKVKQQTKQSRLKLQGKEAEANLESMIDATIAHNKSKGNMTREQAINLLKSSGKLPANY